jgi:hypothetical protein
MALHRVPAALLSLFLLAPLYAAGCASESEVVDDGAGAIAEEALQISKVPVAGPDDQGDQYLLDVTLGRISQSRFDTLHLRFGTKASERFDASKVYKLVDFFPSFARKVNGKVLEPHETVPESALLEAMASKEMTTDGKAYVDANCHSVTWQWVNFLQGTGSDESTLTLMDGQRLFDQTADFASVDEDDLIPGDVYFVKGDGGLEQVDAILHSGVYVGDGLVFEKSNPGEQFPYRIAYLKDVTAKYKRVDANMEIFYRRVARTPVVPTIAQEVSLLAEKAERGLTTVDDRILAKYQVQETFNFELEKSEFTLGWIMPSASAGTKLHPYSQR